MKKKKFKIEFSEQARKAIDDMLEAGDKEGFKEVTDLINKIAENPYSGNRFISEKNDIMLDRLNALNGLSLDGWNDIECEDPNIIALLVGNKEINLMDAIKSGTYKPGDKSKDYKFNSVVYRRNHYVILFKNSKGKELIISAKAVCVFDCPGSSAAEQRPFEP